PPHLAPPFPTRRSSDLVAAGDPRTPTRRALTHAWNAFGALDLVVAVATATWVTLHAVTPGVQPVLVLPLVLIPTFFVPIFLASQDRKSTRLNSSHGSIS